VEKKAKMNKITEGNYKMDHEKRGIALVINIQTFDPTPDPREQLEERIWSVKDVENLTKTLGYLEFELKLFQNLTKAQLKQKVEEQAKLNHTNSDCFLCVIMSHGIDEKIVTSDNQEVSFEEIMAPIKSCKSLFDKPKLFFFQACRGKFEMKRPDSSESTSSGRNQSDKHTRNNKSDSSLNSQKTLINIEADLLVYNATLPKHYAYGNEMNDGTIFIESVCDVLFNEAYKNLPNNLSLSQMITKVNKKVEEKGIQLADPIVRLKKEVYFTPKNVSTF
jgi:caspase 7